MRNATVTAGKVIGAMAAMALSAGGVLASAESSLRPTEASRRDLLVHHSKEYLRSLKFFPSLSALRARLRVVCC